MFFLFFSTFFDYEFVSFQEMHPGSHSFCHARHRRVACGLAVAHQDHDRRTQRRANRIEEFRRIQLRHRHFLLSEWFTELLKLHLLKTSIFMSRSHPLRQQRSTNQSVAAANMAIQDVFVADQICRMCFIFDDFFSIRSLLCSLFVVPLNSCNASDTKCMGQQEIQRLRRSGVSPESMV